MLIDMHQHLHEPGTVKWAEMHRIDRTVLLAGGTNNDEVLRFCRENAGVYIPYCFLDLSDISKACEQARQFNSEGFVGCKFQPLTQRFLPHEKRMRPLWETLQELGMPLTSHSGSVTFSNHCVNYADPSGWSEVAWDFPKLRIVIAHMGGDYHTQALAIAEACENVWLDTAYLHWFCARSLPRVTPAELVTRAVRYAGAGSVVYASEGMTPQFIWDNLDVSLDDRKLIFWKNALKVLGEPDM